ncbi:hypothetical protein QCA50_014545 [Cerrena zonata]|uniref:Uncharacterized protein n=1 Tax=Cerrena zonata TaxID=2478898 RepID=A0AAW0FU07_9APHY
MITLFNDGFPLPSLAHPVLLAINPPGIGRVRDLSGGADFPSIRPDEMADQGPQDAGPP